MNSNNRDYITSVKCVSSIDEVISSMLIILKINILHKWCQKNDLNENTLIKINEINYLNDDLILN